MKHMLDSLTDDPRDNLWECVDCLRAFDYWPSDNMPDSECPGEPSPVNLAIRDATTGLPDVVKERMLAHLIGE